LSISSFSVLGLAVEELPCDKQKLTFNGLKSAISYMPTAPYELPYEGAKEMLLVENSIVFFCN